MATNDERQRRWTAHCLRMAEATHSLADWCDDLEMMRAYADLAARWINMSAEPPPAPTRPDLH